MNPSNFSTSFPRRGLAHAGRACGTLFAALVACGAGTSAAAAGASELEAAHHAYYWGRFDESLAAYEQLAAQGDAEAAERAGFMLLQGRSLYGAQVAGDLQRAVVLLTQASRAGRSGAGFLLGMIERAD